MSDVPLIFFELLKIDLEDIGFPWYKHMDPLSLCPQESNVPYLC